MKYLEQRVNELEVEVALLKAKNKLNDTSKYLNNYPKHIDPYKLETKTTELITKVNDYMYNPSVNLMSEPELETAFASSWDEKLSSFTFKLSSITNDTMCCNQENGGCFDCTNISEYPDIIGSWDDKSYNEAITYNEFKLNHEDMITSWQFTSEYDIKDKDFLEYLNTKKDKENMKTYTEQNIEKEFGEIVSKFNVFHHCWESDGHGYVVKKNGSKQLILTNHGKPYIAKVSDLNLKISEYKTIIQETERAIFLLK